MIATVSTYREHSICIAEVNRTWRAQIARTGNRASSRPPDIAATTKDAALDMAKLVIDDGRLGGTD